MASNQGTYTRSLTVAGAAIGVRGAGTFVTDSFTNDNNESLFVTAVVPAASGTGQTMTHKLQWSPDNGTTWLDLDATNAVSPNLAAAGNSGYVVGRGLVAAAAASANQPIPRLLRVSVTIGGTTPSYTFTGIYVNGAL